MASTKGADQCAEWSAISDRSPDLIRSTIRLAVSGETSELRDMSPPDQDPAIIEHGGREPLLGVVKLHRLNGKALLSFQVRRDLVPQEVLVSFLLGGLLFVPDHHLDGVLVTPGGGTVGVC